MTKPKTAKNDASVEMFLASKKEVQKQTDCLTVLELMKKLTGEPAVLGKGKGWFWHFSLQRQNGWGRLVSCRVFASQTGLGPLPALRIGEARCLVGKARKAQDWQVVPLLQKVWGLASANAQEADQENLQIPSYWRRNHWLVVRSNKVDGGI